MSALFRSKIMLFWMGDLPCVYVCSHERCASVSTADDGRVADFLKDLFTVAASNRAFVVVIKFLMP